MADIRQFEYKSVKSKQVASNSLVIDELVIDSPTLQFEINKEGFSNFRRLFAKPTTDSKSEPASQAKSDTPAAFNLDIRSINLKGGEVFFADLAMRPNFNVDVKRFNATLLGVSNAPGRYASVAMDGVDVPNGQGGILVVKRPWPSMIRTIWNDADRFVKSYFPEELGGTLYLAGDGAIRNKDTGYFTITGRIDDVLNVSGHRMGTMEIESCLVANPLVAEAAVVGRPDELTGEAICVFVVLKGGRPTGDDAKKLATELRNWVGKEIGPIAKPKDVRFGDNLPKTRSGKIMRRLLRVIAKGEEVTQDTSTLENPHILDQLKESL
jgi:acyl-CoA synthetase (AMP-forming)/AMP-acid ligase II